ncbi:MAG TPA: cytochrome c oxidase assembly protein [Bellilinea sp.]|nr:cytochrome c oxidase assembly protein [Bellilinea sp.]
MSALLQVGWSWYPSVIIGLSLWTLLYDWVIRRGWPTPVAQQIAFHCGTLVALLALISPLDELGDRYLFSAHMTQHLLLMFVVAPLWLVGTPGWLLDKLVPRRLLSWINKVLGVIPAFFIFVGVMAFWHVPLAFEWAQGSETVHILEHLSFIGAALIGWWPVAGPDSSGLLKPRIPARMLYTFLLAFPCTALASWLTFAKSPLYTFYVAAPHPFGMNTLQDQHLGGLLMWLPTHMILLLALGITFWKWLRDSARGTERNFVEQS